MANANDTLGISSALGDHLSSVLIRALIIHGSQLVVDGLRDELRGRLSSRDVVVDCLTSEEIQPALRRYRPNVILLDEKNSSLLTEFATFLNDEKPLVFLVWENGAGATAVEVVDLDFVMNGSGFRTTSPFELISEARKRLLERGDVNNALDHVLRLWEGKDLSPTARKVAFKSSGRLLVMRTENVIWIEREGKGARVYARTESFSCRFSVTECVSRFPKDLIIKISSGVAVNVEHVREIRRVKREVTVVLEGGKEFQLAHGYVRGVKELIDALWAPKRLPGSRRPQSKALDQE